MSAKSRQEMLEQARASITNRARAPNLKMIPRQLRLKFSSLRRLFSLRQHGLMSAGVIFATGRDHRSRLQRFRIVIPQSFTASRRPLAADVDGPGYKAEAAPLARRRLD
jgi:hypothetical protein